jgi:transposase
MTVPGIGPIISSAMVAAIGNGSVFSKGRDFGAWLGLVPKQISTGDRTILGKVSKRGNRYLRVLFAAAEHLGSLRTPAGEPIPPNTFAALKRDLERHQIIKRQIREIEQTRLDGLAQAPAKGPHAMVRLLARVVGIGVETADMLVQEVLSRRNEILSWLRTHPEVNRFAVLDDEDDELDGLPLFQPSAVTGLTVPIAQGLADYLQGHSTHDMRSSRLSQFYKIFTPFWPAQGLATSVLRGWNRGDPIELRS